MVSMSIKTGLKNTIISVQSITTHIEVDSRDIEDQLGANSYVRSLSALRVY